MFQNHDPWTFLWTSFLSWDFYVFHIYDCIWISMSNISLLFKGMLWLVSLVLIFQTLSANFESVAHGYMILHLHYDLICMMLHQLWISWEFLKFFSCVGENVTISYCASSGLSNLTYLGFRKSFGINAEGLRTLSSLINLEKLDLDRCPWIHGGLIHLKGSAFDHYLPYMKKKKRYHQPLFLLLCIWPPTLQTLVLVSIHLLVSVSTLSSFKNGKYVC